MRLKLITVSIMLLFVNSNLSGQETINIEKSFDKIIVSPHIEATLKKEQNQKLLLKI